MIMWWELEEWTSTCLCQVTGSQPSSLYEMTGFALKSCLETWWENQWQVADLCHSISWGEGSCRVMQPSRTGWYAAGGGRGANGVLKDLSLPHPSLSSAVNRTLPSPHLRVIQHCMISGTGYSPFCFPFSFTKVKEASVVFTSQCSFNKHSNICI